LSVDALLIEKIRASSRTMVRELGFMQATLAATEYSPSAVHTLLELDVQGGATAGQLVHLLGLEKSSVSRMISKLIDAGEIREATREEDSRVKQLFLSAKGKQTVNKIHQYGQQQVQMAMEHLSTSQQQLVVQGLTTYAQALQICRKGQIEELNNSIEIASGYRSGVIGRITEMHASFYSKHSGFGQFFESQVAKGLAEFTSRLDKPCNQIWVALQNGKIVGSVAVDGEDLKNGEAHLRWFILDEAYRGSGIGRKLLEQAITFCDEQRFPAIQLWTFKGLDAARKLYESFAFTLKNEEEGTQWGSVVTEQQFTRFISN